MPGCILQLWMGLSIFHYKPPAFRDPTYSNLTFPRKRARRWVLFSSTCKIRALGNSLSPVFKETTYLHLVLGSFLCEHLVHIAPHSPKWISRKYSQNTGNTGAVSGSIISPSPSPHPGQGQPAEGFHFMGGLEGGWICPLSFNLLCLINPRLPRVC